MPSAEVDGSEHMPYFVSGVVITLDTGTQTSSASPIFPSIIGRIIWGSSVSGFSGAASATYFSSVSGSGSGIGPSTDASSSFASSASGCVSECYGSGSFKDSGNGSGYFSFSTSYPIHFPES